ncbi:hypothetical protein ABT084_16255 [Streptomyces sp. NPDC002138]|uniref:hypothetical protein n=1 Tax=Streptomyces sp. NPDC002138 TaxID=3154410 RepID=UPI00331E83E5
METVLDLLLIRFAVIAGVAVVLALAVFAVAVALKRKGKLDALRRHATPLVRDTARLLAERGAGRGRPRGRGRDARR